MQPETWLVTGANGFLGANLAIGLADATCVGVSRSAPAPGLFTAWHAGDDLDTPRLIASVRPTIVVNCAAVSSHESCQQDPAVARRVNAQAAGAAAASAAEVGAAFVQVSTDAVFSGARGGYAEDDEPEPFSVYGETKLLGEQAVRDAHPLALIVRTNFFGWSPAGTRSILEFFVSRLRAGELMLGYSDFTVTSLYAGHLVEAIRALVRKNTAGVVHVGSSDAVTKLDFGRLVARHLRIPDTLITPASAGAGGHATSRARDLSLDTALAASILGRALPTQESGITAALVAEGAVRARFDASAGD